MNGYRTHKERIADVFSHGAAGYGDIAYFHQHGHRLVELAAIGPTEHVLDVACGRGAVLFPAAERVGEAGSLVGIDISPRMADQTRAEIGKRGLNQATARTMDAESLDFNDASFDHVLCGFSLQFFPDLPQALREFHRVLKPGGQLAVSAWGPDDPVWDWFDDLVASYGATASLRSQKLDDPEKVASFLKDAGFVGIESLVEDTEVVYAHEDEWWNVRWSLSSRAALDKLDPEKLVDLLAEVNSRLPDMKQADGYHEAQTVIYMLASTAGG